jgi:hypothetical protein
MENFKITVCGAGAIGSNLVYHLAKQGYKKIKAIDRDRVELHNVPTQLWSTRDVGAVKVKALQNIIHRDVGILIEVLQKEVTAANAKSLLKGSDLVVDAFDNWTSRIAVGKACETLTIPCVHAGMSNDGFAEVKWNESYKYGSPEREGQPQTIPCDVALSRSLIMLTVCVTAELIALFIKDGRKLNKEITLGDLKILDIC